jgi:spermidine synthase
LPESRSERAYALAAAVAVGLGSAVFIRVWGDLLPPCFPPNSLNRVWPPAGFLMGVLLGALVLGRGFRSVDSPLRALALCTTALGISGIPAGQLAGRLTALPLALARSGHSPGIYSAILLPVLAFAILVIPGMLAGGALCLAAIVAGRNSGRDLPGSPVLPTALAGAAAGTALAGIWMVPVLGHMNALIIGASITAGLGIARLLAGTGSSVLVAPPPSPRPEHPLGSLPYVAALLPALLLASLWGLILGDTAGPGPLKSAIYQTILWVGLAVGAGAFSGLARRGIPAGLPGLVTAGSALAWLVLPHLAEDLPFIYARAANSPGSYGMDMLWGYAVVALVTVLGPAVLSGTALARLQSPGLKNVAAAAGTGAAALLLGAALPAQEPGLWQTATGLPWIILAAGLLSALLPGGSRRPRLVLAGCIVGTALALSFTTDPWNRGIMTAGLHRYPQEASLAADIRKALPATRVVYYEESPNGITGIVGTPDAVSLKFRGIPRASTGNGIIYSELAAHIPLLLHPSPERVLLIGLDTGVAAGAVAAHPIREIHCIEPEPAMPGAARTLSGYNHNVQGDPRFRLIASSPEYALASSGILYDLIVLPPAGIGPAPWGYPDPAFLQLVRSRLDRGGLVCLPVDLPSLSTDGMRTISAEFASGFPGMSVWWAGPARLIMVGGLSRPAVRPSDHPRRSGSPGLGERLERLGLDRLEGLLSLYMTDRAGLNAFAGDAPAGAIPPITYMGEPGVPLGRDQLEILSRLTSAPGSALGILSGSGITSRDSAAVADLSARSERARRLFVRGMTAARQDQLRQASSLLEEAMEICPENLVLRSRVAEFYMATSRRLLASGEPEDALKVARRAVEVDPEEARTYYNLARVEARRDPATAVSLARNATRLDSHLIPAYLLQAEMELARGRAEDAEDTAAEVLSREPFNSDANYLLGASLLQQGMTGEARPRLESVVEANPYHALALSALGYIALQGLDVDRAESYYRRAYELAPHDLSILNNYATVLAEKGNYSRAIRIWNKALELDPGNASIKENISEAKRSMGG